MSGGQAGYRCRGFEWGGRLVLYRAAILDPSDQPWTGWAELSVCLPLHACPRHVSLLRRISMSSAASRWRCLPTGFVVLLEGETVSSAHTSGDISIPTDALTTVKLGHC